MSLTARLPWTGILLFCVGIALLEVMGQTPPLFAVAMGYCLFCMGAIYNLVGGLRSLSGILFVNFAVRTLVISQVSKAFMFESATSRLDVPMITAEVYAVFFSSLTLAAFLLRKTRYPLKTPLRSIGPFSPVLFTVLLVVGCFCAIYSKFNEFDANGNPVHGGLVGLTVQFQFLAILAMIIAMSERIKQSEGTHSLDWRSGVPLVVVTVLGLLHATRTEVLLAPVTYLMAMLMLGRKLTWKHVLALATGGWLFVVFITPFSLVLRKTSWHQDFAHQIASAGQLLAETGGIEDLETVIKGTRRLTPVEEQYYNDPELITLSRFSLIRPDSVLISRGSTGYHYGFTMATADLKEALPTALVGEKEGFGGNLSGAYANMVNRHDYTTSIAFTIIGDSYAAFGWPGVLLVPLLWWLPFYWLVDSLFYDFSSPWTVVGLGVLLIEFTENSMGFALFNLRNVIIIALTAFVIRFVTRLLGAPRGDSEEATMDGVASTA